MLHSAALQLNPSFPLAHEDSTLLAFCSPAHRALGRELVGQCILVRRQAAPVCLVSAADKFPVQGFKLTAWNQSSEGPGWWDVRSISQD
jgi:hypothetical protein